MLVIRLTRKGKQNLAAYRIVLAEKSEAVKGAYIELLGYYNPSEAKKIEFKQDRIEHWISKGAQPSDTVAGLLKLNGMSGMEKFMEPRNKKRKSKNAPEAAPAAPAPAVAPEAAPAEETSAA